MSDNASSEAPRWARAGCLVYLLFGTFWCLGNMFVWSMGPCPAFSSNTVCEWSTFKTFWYFPGSQIVFVFIGLVLLKTLNKLSKK